MEPMRRFGRIAAVVLPITLAFAAGWVRLPYYAVGPGPARDVEPLIRIDGRTRYQSAGHFVMTTIQWQQVTPLRALVAWLDPATQVVGRDALFPPHVPVKVEQRRSLGQMEQSKIDATSVVLSLLANYPETHGSGVLIESVVDGCPADGLLSAGDTIVRIEGKPVTDERSASRKLDRVPVSEKVDLDVRPSGGGAGFHVALRRARCDNADKPLIGFRLVDPFPFTVHISTSDVGGPSAGLMWALGLYDLLTPGDLTGGRTIAGTGTLDLDGHVGEIGEIGDKVVAAERSGANVFLVPRGNRAELDGLDTGDMKLVSVSSFDQALKYLRTD